MVGIDESYFILIDKDAWDWLDYSGKNLCPNNLSTEMWKALNDEFDNEQDMINFYSEQASDDRAAYLIEAYPYFDATLSLMRFVKKK